MAVHMDGFEDNSRDDIDYATKVRVVTQVTDMLSPARWSIPDDFMTRSHFDRVVNELDWNSSPGVPYCYTATTNRILFKVVDGIPDSSVCDVFWRALQQRLADRSSDPIRLFIKPEPINARKLNAGRFRIISSVSVLDQIIDSMIFGDLNQRIVDTHNFHPIKVGWSPYKGGWRMMPQSGVSIDKSKWDFTVRAWMVALELDIRKALCDNLTPQWVDLATWRFQQLYADAILQTSGGYLYKQKFVGYQKSGCVNTIISNSIMQLILHCRVSNEIGEIPQWIAVLGDDTVQRRTLLLEQYLERLSQYCIIKDVRDGVEFAGHRFMGFRVEPLYRGKHAFNMLHVSPSYYEDLARSYALLYHRSSQRKFIREGLEIVPSILELDVIYDALDE